MFFNHLYSLGETYKICSNIFVILRLGGELIVKNLCFLIISILSLISCEVQTGTKVNHQRVKHIRFVANIFVILRLGGELVVKICGFLIISILSLISCQVQTGTLR